MNLFRIHIFVLLSCLLLACNDSGDDDTELNPSNSAGFCNVVHPDFKLNSKNTNLNTYSPFNSITFKSEDGRNRTFAIGQSELSVFEGIFEDDSLSYCYSIESFETKLSSDDGIELTYLLEPKGYFANFAEAKYADVLKLYYNDTNDTSNDRRIVFRKVLDIKDYPTPLYESTVSIGSRSFIDRDFDNVEQTNFNTPIIVLFHNDDLGIVAYQDEENVIWELESKQ